MSTCRLPRNISPRAKLKNALVPRILFIGTVATPFWQEIRESLLLLVIVAFDICLFVCFTHMVYTHSSQLERKDLAPLLNTGPEKSTKIPLLLSFKGLKLTVSSVKILACEQTLCLGKGCKNREEPLLAIFSPLRFFHQYEW